MKDQPHQINYSQVIPDSHFWTDLESFEQYLSVSSFKERDPNEVINYIKIGIKNTIKQGYNLKKIK